MAAPLELAQERHKGPNHDDGVAAANLGCVERIDPEAKLRSGMRAAAPAGIGERVHRRNTDRAANAVIAERFAREVEGRAAASERSE